MFSEKRFVEIEQMKQRELSLNEVGRVVFEMHRKRILSNTNISRFVNEIENPTHPCFLGNTKWNIQNAMTEVTKKISNPLARINATDRFEQVLRMF